MRPERRRAGESAFYVAGGTLPSGTDSYVTRAADRELFAALMRGELCYVLTARQMGKSSLMVRTAETLRENGVRVAVVDLTSLGQTVTREQWYRGLLGRVGDGLGVWDELIDFWQSEPELGPLERFLRALRDVALECVRERIVVFVDEVDLVRSLDFSTDEFFAGVRALYNERAVSPELRRLTFCFLGVASPSELVGDTRITPFNVGHRIELEDFTAEEATPLARGLAGGDVSASQGLLSRVLYWTGGHPYLTQRLCGAVARTPDAGTAGGVDRLCEELLLTRRARERDTNLLFVRDRLLRGDVDPARLLTAYGGLLKGRGLAADETNPVAEALRLSGIARVEAGRLRVRNRVYERVFDAAWVRDSMPDAERRRQRAAFRRGLLRASAVASVVVGLLLALSWVAIDRGRRAARQELENRRLLYAATMKLASQAWQSNDVLAAQKYLESLRPAAGLEDFRGVEWHLLWALCQNVARRLEIGPPGGAGWYMRYSDDGSELLLWSKTGEVRAWDTATGHVRELGQCGNERHLFSQLSPDGSFLATGSVVTGDSPFPPPGGPDLSAALWDVTSGRKLADLPGHMCQVEGLAFSPDGRMLATGCSNSPTVRLWEAPTGRSLGTVGPLVGPAEAEMLGGNHLMLCFTPDGESIVAVTNLNEIEIRRTTTIVTVWRVGGGRSASFRIPDETEAIALSPDGQRLATGGTAGVVHVWDRATGRPLQTFRGHTQQVTKLEFSRDGSVLASASRDLTVRLWDTARGRDLATLSGIREPVGALTISPDLSTVAASGGGNVAYVLAAVPEGTVRLPDGAEIAHAAVSPDGRTVAAAGRDGAVHLVDAAGRREVARIGTGGAAVLTLAYSPDGALLAAGREDGMVTVWGAASRAELASWKAAPRRVIHVAFSPDGRALATQQADVVTLWDTGEWRPTVEIESGWQSPLLATFSPDGRLLAYPFGDWGLALWDLTAGKWVAPIDQYRARAAAFSPDGRLLAVSTDSGVALWDVATRELRATFIGRISPVTSIAFVPDGTRIVTGAADGTMTIWDAASGVDLATIPAGSGADARSSLGIAVSADGGALISWDSDEVRLWPVDSTDAPANGVPSSVR